MSGLWKIFCFSLRQKLKLKGFRSLTLIVALILFLIPAILLSVLSPGTKEGEAGEGTELSYGVEKFTEVFSVIEYSERPDYLKGFIAYAEAGIPQLDEHVTALPFTLCDDMAKATEAASKKDGAIILRILENNEKLLFNAVLPEGSDLSSDSGESLTNMLVSLFNEYRIQAMDLSPEQLEVVMLPLSAFMPLQEPEDEPEQSDPSEEPALSEEEIELAEKEQQRESYLNIIMPMLAFINLIIIYFLVLYHNRDIGQIVILEKSSKLMDTFLISVKPRAMIFGKVLSVWLSALIQFAIWILALLGGVVAGAKIGQRLHPDSPSLVMTLLEVLRDGTKLFSLPNVLLALALIALGFLVYMVLAAIFASFASRQEDLSSSQGIFNMVLILSYFVALRYFIEAGEAGPVWYDFIPFISCMLTPARVLTGALDLPIGFVSLMISLLAALLFAVIAGMIYNMMSLYKGNVPKFGDVMKMLRTQK